jgi:hypothetical protein
MRAKKPLLHGDITASIIDSFFDFRGEPLAYERMDMLVDGAVVIENKAREPLDPDAQGQLFAGLAATNLEVGLVLHFGKKARFYRVFFENRFKQRNQQCP